MNMSIDMIIGVLSFTIITFLCSKNDSSVNEVRYRFLFTAIAYCIATFCIGFIRG